MIWSLKYIFGYVMKLRILLLLSFLYSSHIHVSWQSHTSVRFIMEQKQLDFYCNLLFLTCIMFYCAQPSKKNHFVPISNPESWSAAPEEHKIEIKFLWWKNRYVQISQIFCCGLVFETELHNCSPLETEWERTWIKLKWISLWRIHT